MVNIHLYKYNNYYNRNPKRLEYLVDYNAQGTLIATQYNVNDFNPGDGVNATHVINYRLEAIDQVDYAIVSDPDTTILSRWFVIDANYNRKGQSILVLYRDTVAEKFDSVVNAPMFIEKATVADNSPFIYNAENLTVNEIKTSEMLLKDKTGCAWLVGYMARDYAGGEEKTFEAVAVPDVVLNRIQDYTHYSALLNEKRILNKYFLRVKVRLQGGTLATITYDRGNWYKNGVKQIGDPGNPLPTFTSSQLEQPVSDPSNNITTIAFNSITKEVGKILKVGNEFEKITCSQGGEKEYTYQITTDLSWYGTLLTAVNRITNHEFASFEEEVVVLLASKWIHLWNPVVNQGSFKITIPASRYVLTDAPYDMFCIPYGDSVQYKNSLGSHTFNSTINKDLALSAMQGLRATLGANIYDMQLLPYCPLTGLSVVNGVIDILNADSRASTMIQTSGGSDVAPILWCTRSQNSLSLDYSFNVSNKKISNTCDKLRICSPNYNGVFELNPAKNEGITGILVDYTYMPYNPYIHVAPVFSGLYGSNFGDARGLICQGDFSITAIDDKWADYQINNKNYLNTFNREIQNLELTQGIKRQQAIWQAVAGIGTGAVQGAAAGTQIGGGYGAIAGAVIGGATSAVGGAMDYQNMIKLQEETLDFKHDMFGYNLDNIKALPNGIAKITAITANNKLFPFIEYYTCTEEEKHALANKIRHDGMSVGAISTMAEYLGNSWSYDGIEDRGYIKGKLINTETLDCDYHFAAVLANELNKGVYTK